MFNDRVERTVLMIGRTAEENASRAFAPGVGTDLVDQGRLANTGVTTNQHHLSEPFLTLLPTPPEKPHLLVSPHQNLAPCRHGCVLVLLPFSRAEHARHTYRLLNSFQASCPEVFEGKYALHQMDG